MVSELVESLELNSNGGEYQVQDFGRTYQETRFQAPEGDRRSTGFAPPTTAASRGVASKIREEQQKNGRSGNKNETRVQLLHEDDTGKKEAEL